MENKKFGVLVAVAVIAFAASLARAEKVYDLEDDLDELKVHKTSVYQPQFLEINRELVEETESTEPEKNFELIKEIRSRYQSWFNGDFKKEAVKLFTSLPKSLDNCGYKSYKVLARNFVAAQGRSHQKGGLRRVDGIIRHYAVEHANMCRPQYAELFKEFKSAVDPKVYNHVRELFKEMEQHEGALVKFARMDYEDEVTLITTGLAAININIPNTLLILEALERLIESPEEKRLLYAQPNELNGGYLMSPKFKTEVFEKHIEAPCKSFVAKSKRVFAPARFDAAIEDANQKALLHSADEEFHQAWISHRMCQYMLRFAPWERIERVIAGRIQQ